MVCRAFSEVSGAKKISDIRHGLVQYLGLTLDQMIQYNSKIWVKIVVLVIVELFLSTQVDFGRYMIYWGKVGFSLRIPLKGKLITVFDAYPYSLGLFTEKLTRQYGLPIEIFEEYKNELMKSPIVGSLITSGRRYPNYTDMAPDDVILILQSTDKFVRIISDR